MDQELEKPRSVLTVRSAGDLAEVQDWEGWCLVLVIEAAAGRSTPAERVGRAPPARRWGAEAAMCGRRAVGAIKTNYILASI